MTPERYQALLRWLEARPALKKLVIALNRWLPAVPFACYPLLLVLLNVRWFRLLSANRAAALDFMQLIARAVFVPAFVFLGGTLLRARLNFPRPYEQPGFTPLVEKETYLREESRSIWKRLYQNSVGNFMTALGSGEELSDQDLDELSDFVRKARERSEGK